MPNLVLMHYWPISLPHQRLKVKFWMFTGVRSSLARQLGIDIESPVAVSDKSHGVASLIKDAVTHWQQLLTLDTLLQWHRWLFQGQTSLLHQ